MGLLGEFREGLGSLPDFFQDDQAFFESLDGHLEAGCDGLEIVLFLLSQGEEGGQEVSVFDELGLGGFQVTLGAD